MRDLSVSSPSGKRDGALSQNVSSIRLKRRRRDWNVMATEKGVENARGRSTQRQKIGRRSHTLQSRLGRRALEASNLGWHPTWCWIGHNSKHGAMRWYRWATQ